MGVKHTLWAMLTAIGLLVLMLPPVSAQQVVVIKAWTIGPDNPSVTRFNNLNSAAERLNADLRREGACDQTKVEGSSDTAHWDSYLRRGVRACQTGDSPYIVECNAALAATWAPAGFSSALD